MLPPPRPLPLVVELAALTLWLGASILFAAVVAPALFTTLTNRTLAGDVVGRVLPVLLYGGILVSLLALTLESGAGYRLLSWRCATAALTGVASIVALGIGWRIDRLRAAIGGPVDALAANDPRRVDFGRLHGLSVAALGVGLLAAAVLAVSAAHRLSARALAQPTLQPTLEPSQHA
jgi:Domain of unknown function (DUF4149)